jgi:hypothetical protein
MALKRHNNKTAKALKNLINYFHHSFVRKIKDRGQFNYVCSFVYLIDEIIYVHQKSQFNEKPKPCYVQLVWYRLSG